MTDWDKNQETLAKLLDAFEQLADRSARVKMNIHFALYDISPHLAFGGQLPPDSDQDNSPDSISQKVKKLQEQDAFLVDFLSKIYRTKEKIKIMILKGNLYIRYKNLMGEINYEDLASPERKCADFLSVFTTGATGS